MNRQRWERVQEIFHSSIGVQGEERETFLKFACADDFLLQEEVKAMLAADGDGGSLLDRGLSEVAFQMLAEGSDRPPTEEFGPYQLKRILGEGGMGTVWLAERTDVGNLVAIKFLPHAGLSPARRERFNQETRTLGRLRHPLIARLYDAGTLENGTPWFAMEYVDGVPVTRYCVDRRLGVEERLRLFRAICSAIVYAHGQAILHRDLKPSNILVEADGTPKVLDFGIARELQRLGDAVEETRPGLRFMSPPYAAPEWICDGVVGLQTDVYSLGVLLYELLTGGLPTHPEVARQQATDAVPTQAPQVVERPSRATQRLRDKDGESSLNSGGALSGAVWEDLDLLCLKALHRDQAQRYGSVEALMRDVDHFLHSEPLEARPDSARYKLGKFVKRNRRAVLAVSLVVMLMVIGTAVFLWRLAGARDAALAEAARTRRIQAFLRDMLGGQEIEAAPSKDLRVVTLLDHGVEQADALQADPETQSELYENLGTMYDMLGDFPKADQLLRKAVEKKKSLSGDKDQRMAELLVELGVVSGDAGRFQESEQQLHQALKIEQRSLPEDDLRLADARSELGRVLVQAGSYPEAIAELESVIKNFSHVRRKQPGPEADRMLSRTLLALAVADNSAGKQDLAEGVIQQALALDRSLYGKGHPEVAQLLFNLGTTKFMRGQYAEAERLYRQASEIESSWYGADHPDAATMRSGLAKTLLVEGKDREAEPILQASLKIMERAYGDSDRVANTLDSLGRIALKRGNVREAVTLLNRAEDMDAKVLGEDSLRTAAIKLSLAEAYTTQDKLINAEMLLRSAVLTLKKGLPAGNLRVAVAEEKWGRVLLKMKSFAEAREQLRSAEKVYEQNPQASADAARVRGDLEKAGWR